MINKSINKGFERLYNGLIVLAILFLWNACQKVDLNEINNLNGNRITLIGHGGIGFESPQNALPHDSFSSLTKAVEAFGTEGVEVDIQLSADGTLFMYHDDVLETGTDCFGCVFYKESEELLNCRFRSSFRSNLFLNEKLDKLESVLQVFALRPIKPKVIFDIKFALEACGDFDYDTYEERFVAEIARLITKYDALDWCYVEAGKFDFLMALQEKLPAIKLSFITGSYEEEEIIEVANNGIYMISSTNNAISKEFVQFIHEQGLRVAIYGVKIRSAAVEAINKSPDYIYADNIILLQEMLR